MKWVRDDTRNFSRAERPSIRDVGIQGGSINGDKQDVGRKGGGEGAEDGEEVVRIFNL